LNGLQRCSVSDREAADQWIGTLSLDHRDAWNARHQAQFVQFAEALAQSRAVAEIATGNNQMVRNSPVEGLGNFECRLFLPLKPVGIHRVEQMDWCFFHDPRQQRYAAIEISLQ